MYQAAHTIYGKTKREWYAPLFNEPSGEYFERWSVTLPAVFERKVLGGESKPPRSPQYNDIHHDQLVKPRQARFIIIQSLDDNTMKDVIDHGTVDDLTAKLRDWYAGHMMPTNYLH